MYPPIEPHRAGMLDVGDGHQMYFEVCGNPAGRPAVVLHGGPGSGCSPRWRQYFDPQFYRIVLFDQRACGRSTPHASDRDYDLSLNTTPHLLRDIEQLRRHLNIDRWLVLGGSWGSTLGLAYAQQHPDRVSQLVLFSVVTTSRREVAWVTRDMGRVFPAQWAQFRDGVPRADQDGDLAAAYARLLNDPDPAKCDQAAQDWCRWEDTHVALDGATHDKRYDDPKFRLGFARLVTHYWSNAAWLDEDILVTQASKLTGIPGALIAGQRDVSGPPDIAWRLAQEWPDAELTIVGDAAHGMGYSGIAQAVLNTIDGFKMDD